MMRRVSSRLRRIRRSKNRGRRRRDKIKGGSK
jgi:hypothetical protein